MRNSRLDKFCCSFPDKMRFHRPLGSALKTGFTIWAAGVCRVTKWHKSYVTHGYSGKIFTGKGRRISLQLYRRVMLRVQARKQNNQRIPPKTFFSIKFICFLKNRQRRSFYTRLRRCLRFGIYAAASPKPGSVHRVGFTQTPPHPAPAPGRSGCQYPCRCRKTGCRGISGRYRWGSVPAARRCRCSGRDCSYKSRRTP